MCLATQRVSLLRGDGTVRISRSLTRPACSPVVHALECGSSPTSHPSAEESTYARAALSGPAEFACFGQPSGFRAWHECGGKPVVVFVNASQTQCASQPQWSTTTTSRACIKTVTASSRSWHRMTPPARTGTATLAKTTPARTSSAGSMDVRGRRC